MSPLGITSYDDGIDVYYAIITGFSSETLSGSLKLLFLCSWKKCPVRRLWWKRKTLFEWPTLPSTPLWVNFGWTPTGVGSTLVPSYMPHIPTQCTYVCTYSMQSPAFPPPQLPTYLPSTSYLPTPQPPTYPPCNLPTPFFPHTLPPSPSLSISFYSSRLKLPWWIVLQAQALSHAMELLHAAWWLWSLEKPSHPLNTILEK
jgi:hypothetical protein